MTSDLEDRLRGRLASQAVELPQPPDRLEVVRERGRRLRSRIRLAVGGLGLAIVVLAVGVGTGAFTGQSSPSIEVAANSPDRIDREGRSGDRFSEREDSDRPQTDRRARRAKRAKERRDRRRAEYISRRASRVLKVPATVTVTTIPSNNDDKRSQENASQDEVAMESSTTADSNGAATPTTETAPANSLTTTSPATTAPSTSAPVANNVQKPPKVATGSTGMELASLNDFSYQGAFRVSSEDFGDSNANYAVGTLAYNESNHSLFVVGHAHDNAIAEFAIPRKLGTGQNLTNLPLVNQPVQPFTKVLDRAPNPDNLDRITGMTVFDGALLVNAENWYDAAGNANDTSLVVSNAANLAGKTSGFYQMEGGAQAAGYMSPVPPEWQATFGGPLLTGWASNYSIISRYSIGPSLFGFNASDLRNGKPGPVDTTTHMAFPMGTPLSPDALAKDQGKASAVWNFLSRGVYGFIVPGTRTFAVVGSSGGVDSGIGYKITQDDGNLCGGYCSRKVSDNYNYYWLFDLDQIAAASDPSTLRPYDYGRWNIPFDGNGQHRINGASFDPESSTLYMALDEAGQVEAYDRPPVIVAYKIG